MSFLMDLRDDDTYTYIKNNLAFTGPPVVPVMGEFVPPYDLVGGKYYTWVWNGTYWVLTDNYSTIYVEDDPPNQSTYHKSGCPSKIVPYNGYGYFAVGLAGNVEIRKINFSTNVVTTVQAYSVTYEKIVRTAATLYDNFVLFLVVVGDDTDHTSVSNVSVEIIKMALDESCTQLYSADLSFSSTLRWVGIGCDGTNVYASISGLTSVGSQCFYVPLGGGARTDIKTVPSSYSYSGTRYLRYSDAGGGGEYLALLTDSIDKMWDLDYKSSAFGIIYIMDDSSYPIYAISSTDSRLHALKLNSDESHTEITTLLSSSLNHEYLRFPPTFRAEGRSVLHFPCGSTSRYSAEIRLPYRDVL